MKFTTGVTAAVYRYNPGIIAQAFASLDRFVPRSYWTGYWDRRGDERSTSGFRLA